MLRAFLRTGLLLFGGVGFLFSCGSFRNAAVASDKDMLSVKRLNLGCCNSDVRLCRYLFFVNSPKHRHVSFSSLHAFSCLSLVAHPTFSFFDAYTSSVSWVSWENSKDEFPWQPPSSIRNIKCLGISVCERKTDSRCGWKQLSKNKQTQRNLDIRVICVGKKWELSQIQFDIYAHV